MSDKLYPSHAAPQLSIRFDSKAMKKRIKRLADSEGRTMNSQIIQMLKKSLADYDQSTV